MIYASANCCSSNVHNFWSLNLNFVFACVGCNSFTCDHIFAVWCLKKMCHLSKGFSLAKSRPIRDCCIEVNAQNIICCVTGGKANRLSHITTACSLLANGPRLFQLLWQVSHVVQLYKRLLPQARLIIWLRHLFRILQITLGTLSTVECA